MSEQPPAEQSPRTEQLPYDSPENEYGDFINYVYLFDKAASDLATALVDGINAKAGEEYVVAREHIDKMTDELSDSLEALAIFIFQPEVMNTEEAIQIWATLVHGELQNRIGYFKGIHPTIDFPVPDRSEVEEKARAYAKGRAKLQGEPDNNESHDFRPYEGAEHIHEITNGELDWTDLSDVSEEDEYGEWVHDEYSEVLDQQIQAVLDIARKPFAH